MSDYSIPEEKRFPLMHKYIVSRHSQDFELYFKQTMTPEHSFCDGVAMTFLVLNCPIFRISVVNYALLLNVPFISTQLSSHGVF